MDVADEPTPPRNDMKWCTCWRLCAGGTFLKPRTWRYHRRHRDAERLQRQMGMHVPGLPVLSRREPQRKTQCARQVRPISNSTLSPELKYL